MKFFVLVVSMFLVGSASAQQSDSAKNASMPHHFFSVNPVNSLILQQAGINYEYAGRKWGAGVDLGFVYPNELNYSRIFMAATNGYGAFESYSGYYFIPRVNFSLRTKYFSRRINRQYLLLKGVSKKLVCDSTKYLVWYNEEGADLATYRKQKDEATILGAFLCFGSRNTFRHFFMEYSFGVGWLNISQKMAVANELYTGTPLSGYPYEDNLERDHFAVSLEFRLGYAF
ncbi:MAG: hypothetical protein CVU11_00410 [Bacteroidetes bacterium HGW-Bacteroidetes-6]|jgi:hypothetical protein|nr:MAG: hypothetical protein CVU11_00410 [Bacteroidetes bacterium HGW-Bacteroidetes-6]